jgi:hypothetical protein
VSFCWIGERVDEVGTFVIFLIEVRVGYKPFYCETACFIAVSLTPSLDLLSVYFICWTGEWSLSSVAFSWLLSLFEVSASIFLSSVSIEELLNRSLKSCTALMLFALT